MQYSTQAAWVGLDCAWNISLLGDFKQTRSSPELFPAANLMYFRVVGQPDHLTSWSISVSKRWPRLKSHWFILYPKGCSLISQKCVLNRASQDGGAQKRSSYELWVTILSGRYQFHSSVAILFLFYYYYFHLYSALHHSEKDALHNYNKYLNLIVSSQSRLENHICLPVVVWGVEKSSFCTEPKN